MSKVSFKAHATRRPTFERNVGTGQQCEFDALHTEAFTTPVYPADWPDGIDVLVTVTPIEPIPEKEES